VITWSLPGVYFRIKRSILGSRELITGPQPACDIKYKPAMLCAREMIKEKVISLGEMAAAELGCLERLGPGLWSGEFDALHPFGIGLAQGSVDLIATYERLLSLVQLQAPAKLNPQVLQGYISAANDIDPRLAMVMMSVSVTGEVTK